MEEFKSSSPTWTSTVVWSRLETRLSRVAGPPRHMHLRLPVVDCNDAELLSMSVLCH